MTPGWRLLCAIGAGLFVWGVLGCTPAELDHVDSPIPGESCTPQNPYWCGDGTGTCCTDELPTCGQDDSGLYCQAPDLPPSPDPFYQAQKPKRGPRVK